MWICRLFAAVGGSSWMLFWLISSTSWKLRFIWLCFKLQIGAGLLGSSRVGPNFYAMERILKTKTSAAARRARLGPLRAIGTIRSSLKDRKSAPRQGSEGAPDAWLHVNSSFAKALDGLKAGDVIIVITWLHKARREVLKVHPRSIKNRPLTGVFATRSPDRPNPLGLHQVTVRRILKNKLLIGPIEAIDGTPVVDIKPILC